MSTAEELLNSLSADSEGEGHIVIGNDRFITVPESLKRIAVQYDHNIETVTFDCPRYWDGLDMSTMAIYINYMCPDGTLGLSFANNIVIDNLDTNIMHFDWTISRNATMFKGQLTFLICIKKTNAEGEEQNHWNSELNRDMHISEGLECDEIILEQYPDVVTDIFNGKRLISSAITYMGVLTNASDNFQRMAGNIKSISTTKKTLTYNKVFDTKINVILTITKGET